MKKSHKLSSQQKSTNSKTWTKLPANRWAKGSLERGGRSYAFFTLLVDEIAWKRLQSKEGMLAGGFMSLKAFYRNKGVTKELPFPLSPEYAALIQNQQQQKVRQQQANQQRLDSYRQGQGDGQHQRQQQPGSQGDQAQDQAPPGAGAVGAGDVSSQQPPPAHPITNGNGQSPERSNRPCRIVAMRPKTLHLLLDPQECPIWTDTSRP